MTMSPTWSKFLRFARALASPDALRLAAASPSPVAAYLELLSPVIDTPRLRAFDEQSRRPRTLLARGGSR